jgi:hypothetical protein
MRLTCGGRTPLLRINSTFSRPPSGAAAGYAAVRYVPEENGSTRRIDAAKARMANPFVTTGGRTPWLQIMCASANATSATMAGAKYRRVTDPRVCCEPESILTPPQLLPQ